MIGGLGGTARRVSRARKCAARRRDALERPVHSRRAGLPWRTSCRSIPRLLKSLIGDLVQREGHIGTMGDDNYPDVPAEYPKLEVERAERYREELVALRETARGAARSQLRDQAMVDAAEDPLASPPPSPAPTGLEDPGYAPDPTTDELAWSDEETP